MIIKIMADGGSMKPGPALSQKLGPLGINIGKVISGVNEATKNFSGLKVPVELDVNAKSKTFKINVLSPPVAELIKKELELEKASGDAKKIKAGNLAIEQIIKIAKIKSSNMLSKNLKTTLTSILGSCVSLGILVENKEAKEVIKELKQGIYDKEIKEEKTEPSPDKLNQIKKYFEEIKKKQDEIIKKEMEEKAAKEAQKEEQAGITPGAPATPQTTITPSKIPEKKEEKEKK